MIGVIALLARPRFLPEVLANFDRQTHRNKLLVVVENGPGIGACRAHGRPLPKGATVLRTEADRSLARNAGLQHLRAVGVDYWALFEDDDLYEPGYLAEHWTNRGRADALGKGSFILQSPDGSRWPMFPGWAWRRIELEKGFVRGGLAAATLFGSTAAAVDWTPGCPWGEEVLWYTDMLRAGRTLYSTSPDNFVRRRFDGADHAHATPGSWRDEVAGAHAIPDLGGRY